MTTDEPYNGQAPPLTLQEALKLAPLARQLAPPHEHHMREPPADFVDWDSFWDTDHQAEDWLIPGLVAKGRLHAVYADAKQGKSYVTLEAVARATLGHSVWGQTPVAPITVVYIDFEMTESDLAERLEEYGLEGRRFPRLHYWLLPDLEALDDPDGGRRLLQVAQAVEADLVVIDTLGRAVRGAENDADTYNAAYRATFMPLKAAGIAVLRIDHSGKDDSKGMRGSSAKSGDVDIAVKVARTSGGGQRITATHRRISWYPELTVLNKIVDNDGYIRFDRLEELFPDGTEADARTLEAAGIDSGMNHRDAQEAARTAGVKMSNTRRRAALRWLKKERPKYLREPDPETLNSMSFQTGHAPGAHFIHRPGARVGARDPKTPSDQGAHDRGTPGHKGASTSGHKPHPYRGAVVSSGGGTETENTENEAEIDPETIDLSHLLEDDPEGGVE